MLRRVLPLLLGALLLVTPGSAAAEPISPRDLLDAAMVSGASGWAQTNQGLYWTEDGGATWRDITPWGKRRRSPQAVSSQAGTAYFSAVGTHRVFALVRESRNTAFSIGYMFESWAPTTRP